MLTPAKIKDAICETLLERFPDCTYYTAYENEKFERPSFHVVTDRMGRTEKLTRRVSGFTLFATVIYHAETDGYYGADERDLEDALETVCDIFAREYLYVEDRAVRCRVTGSEIRERDAYADLEIRYTEAMGVPDGDATEDVIGSVGARVKTPSERE